MVIKAINLQIKRKSTKTKEISKNNNYSKTAIKIVYTKIGKIGSIQTIIQKACNNIEKEAGETH
jgi:hypothetical protein